MPQDLELLQGSWTITAMEMDGQTMPVEMLADARVVVKGDRFTSTGMGAMYKGKLSLDATRKPRQLDMRFDAGPEKGNTNLCIYQLKDDTWKLCIATRGTVRPSRFASTAGSGLAVETLVRGGAPVAVEKPAARPSKKAAPSIFEGEWTMVSGVMSGQAMDPSMVSWVRRVFAGNQTAVTAGPQTMMKAEFTIDGPSIDYRNTAGSHKGKSQAGIWELPGKSLTICMAPPGAARPSEFESKKGDGRALTVWKRP